MYMCMCVCVCVYVYYYLVTKLCPTLKTPWTVARQALLSKGFPSKNTGVGCYFILQ